jgi:hypothetical protein
MNQILRSIIAARDQYRTSETTLVIQADLVTGAQDRRQARAALYNKLVKKPASEPM